MKTGAWSEI